MQLEDRGRTRLPEIEILLNHLESVCRVGEVASRMDNIAESTRAEDIVEIEV